MTASCVVVFFFFFGFFFNEPATTEIYTPSLHDALPICGWVALYVRSSGGAVGRTSESVARSVIGGLRYVKGQQVLWATLVLVLIFESSGWTFHTTLVPIFARNELNADSGGLGLLLFAFGAGAVSASLVWAMIGSGRPVGRYMIGSVIVWHASILVFATSQSFYVSMAILVVTGAGFASTQFFMLSALLGNSLSEYRGREIGRAHV